MEWRKGIKTSKGLNALALCVKAYKENMQYFDLNSQVDNFINLDKFTSKISKGKELNREEKIEILSSFIENNCKVHYLKKIKDVKLCDANLHPQEYQHFYNFMKFQTEKSHFSNPLGREMLKGGNPFVNMEILINDDKKQTMFKKGSIQYIVDNNGIALVEKTRISPENKGFFRKTYDNDYSLKKNDYDLAKGKREYFYNETRDLFVSVPEIEKLYTSKNKNKQRIEDFDFKDDYFNKIKFILPEVEVCSIFNGGHYSHLDNFVLIDKDLMEINSTDNIDFNKKKETVICLSTGVVFQEGKEVRNKERLSEEAILSCASDIYSTKFIEKPKEEVKAKKRKPRV